MFRRTYFGLTVWLAATTMALAQGQLPRKVFTNKQSFNVPLRVEDGDRAVLKEIRFYVKPPNSGWMLQERGTPQTARFGYTASADGEYWFAFSTVDSAGREAPISPDREPPRLVVVVDTKAPEVNALPLTVASGQTYVQCTMRDANPDAASLTAECQLPDGNWKPLEILDRELPGVFRAPETGMSVRVRVSGKDKAGNIGTQVVNVDNHRAPTPIAQPVVPSATSPIEVPPAPLPVAVAVAPEQRVVEKPAMPSAIAKPTVQMLNTRRCVLSYAFDGVPQELVQRVEVFVTRDEGRTWVNLGEDPDKRSPVELYLPEDGTFGFVVLVSTARQPAAPPAASEAPDWWVEIDTTAPEVRLESVMPGVGEEAGLISLRWTVRDKNLKPDAVELSWSNSPEGPWLPIAKGLRAEGQYRWPVPREAGNRTFLKLESSDMAGNVGRFVTPQPVTLETGKPRAKVLGINPAAVRQ